MKKEIRAEDLKINVKIVSDILEGKASDTISQEQGTGSLCISIIMCMPTEKHCDVTKSEGDLCCAMTDTAACRPETGVNCLSATLCPVSQKTCGASYDVCQISVPDCATYTSECIVNPAK